jgi:hypothetical protein
MAGWDSIKTGLDIAKVAVGALEVIQGMTQMGGTPADEALLAISAVIDSVLSHVDGSVSADDVAKKIQSLTDNLKSNDDTVSRQLDDKFGPST